MAVKSIKEQLSEIALQKLKMSDGQTLEQILANAARRLYDCIQYYIDEYYKSYHPVIYKRTYGYHKSLRAEDIADIRVKGNTLSIGVKFSYDFAMHPNLDEVYWHDKRGATYFFPIKDQHESFVPLLMEKGWKADGLAYMIGRHVHHLTYFEGIHAVEKGIADFNRTNKYGLKIKADDFYNGKVY